MHMHLQCGLRSPGVPETLFHRLSTSCNPTRKKSHGVESGERGDRLIRVRRPIHRSGNCSYRNAQTVQELCAGAPSCLKTICCMFATADSLGAQNI